MTVNDLGTFFDGNINQNTNPSLYGDQADRALNYRGVSHLIGLFDMGRETSFPSFAFEIYGRLSEAGVEDINPADMILDFLPNTFFGPSFPSACLAALTNYHTYCQAANLRISLVLDVQRPANDIISEILRATNAAPVWSMGVMDIVPYGDQDIEANGAHYIPPTAPLYDLTDDDFLHADDEAPVHITRKRQADTYNSVKCEHRLREKEYNSAIASAEDLYSIRTYGVRQMGTIAAPFFCRSDYAELSARLLLQRENIRNTYQFKLGFKYIVLDPMDIVTITDSGLGLYRQWVRITEIQENENGDLSITAEEYLLGTGHAPLYGREAPLPGGPGYNDPAPDIFAPTIIEPPDVLSRTAVPGLWIAISGPEFYGGCEIYYSIDNVSYSKIGGIVGSARMGRLTAAVPSGDRFDFTNTLSVEMTTDRALPAARAQGRQILCYVDGEYLAYNDLELTSANNYDLTNLFRGLYTSTIAAHSPNSQFARIDPGLFKMNLPVQFVNKQVYFKFVSFNVFGGGKQAVADLEPYAYTIQGTAFLYPLPNVTNVLTTFEDGNTIIHWTPIQDFRTPIDYEVRIGTNWAGGQILGRTPTTQFPYFMDGTYWIAARYVTPWGVTVYSATPEDIQITGGAIPDNIIISADEAPTWPGVKTNLIQVGGNLVLDGGGNILTLADYLNEPDILYYGEVVQSGSYENYSYFEFVGGIDCRIMVSYQFLAFNVYDNFLTIPDLLAASDILGSANAAYISIRPQLSLKDIADNWGDWVDYYPGHYLTKGVKARLLITTTNSQIEISISSLTLAVDPPDVHYQGYNETIPAAGKWIYYTQPYNLVKTIQITILSPEDGDYVQHHGTIGGYGGFWVQVLNGGAGVERNINWFTAGY